MVPSRYRTRIGPSIISPTALLLLLNLFVHTHTNVPVARPSRALSRHHAACADPAQRRPQQHPRLRLPHTCACAWPATRRHRAPRPSSVLPAAIRRCARVAAFGRTLPLRRAHRAAHGAAQPRRTVAHGCERAGGGARGDAPGGRGAAHAAVCGAH